jgi:hypothetical protein
VGDDVDASNVSHGFVRALDGRIATFNVPGAGTGVYQGTFGFTIDPAGEIIGIYVDASGVSRGFLWNPPRFHG